MYNLVISLMLVSLEFVRQLALNIFHTLIFLYAKWKIDFGLTMKSLFITAILLAFSHNTLAATDLVKDAIITGISNTNGNVNTFTIWLEGGTGLCANKSISFPVTAAGSKESHERAYSAALTAFATGDKIMAHNYYNTDCHNAAYIKVSK
ncbi:DUF5992 family protein [Pseudoalteromonas ardens]|nr:DUF5992 family protein [Pseudoalteromonas sp. R96]MDK1311308.1 DUF5992 family protein [Pseudoalteromonas sp. R96]